MGSVNPVGTSGTVCISAFARPSLPIFNTTEGERVGKDEATELDRLSVFLCLTGDNRPLDGLFRIPLLEVITPLELPSVGRCEDDDREL